MGPICRVSADRSPQSLSWSGVPQPDPRWESRRGGKSWMVLRVGRSGWVAPASAQRGAMSRGCSAGRIRRLRTHEVARTGSVDREVSRPRRESSGPLRERSDYFLRCRILLRIRRFLRPILRRPLPDFLVPMWLFARNTSARHGNTATLPADGDSSRPGDVEQLPNSLLKNTSLGMGRGQTPPTESPAPPRTARRRGLTPFQPALVAIRRRGQAPPVKRDRWSKPRCGRRLTPGSEFFNGLLADRSPTAENATPDRYHGRFAVGGSIVTHRQRGPR